MTRSARGLLLWSPRILGLLDACFLALFALDAVGEGVLALLIHLAPALLLVLVVALSWRRQWVGGAVFLAIAALYGAPAWRHPVQLLVISGPLLAVGLLFLLGWRHHRELHPRE